MGPWWVSQFDPASDVSQAAKRSFQAAFPAQEKRLDALILCTTEIFMYLEENLNLTPQSMSDKATALDELEVMHQQGSGKEGRGSYNNCSVGELVSVWAEAYMEVDLSTCEEVVSFLKRGLPMELQMLVWQNYKGNLQATGGGYKGSVDETIEAVDPLASNDCFVSEAESVEVNHMAGLLRVRWSRLNLGRRKVKGPKWWIMRAKECEGNMKTLAMAILGSFQEKDPTCHSSMNGCFGSQQVSYPALVIFLDAIPPKSITGEKFFLEFFQNFLAGGNPSHSLNADPDGLAFFQAFRECFLWGLQNASRYCGGADAVYSLQVSLIDKILLKLMWHDFLPISPKNQERVFSVESRDPSCCNVKPFHEEAVETFKTKYPIGYIQELGKCIIEILSGIYSLEHDLLLPFSTVFQENCLEIFKQTENVESSSEVIERVITFLLLLGQSAVQKGDKWPLVNMVGPMLAKSFPLIKTLDSPDIVRLASVAVSVFGPRKIIRELVCGGYAAFSSISDCMERELESEQFLQLYKEIFVPWCLQGNGSSTSARLDLLLALLDNECFPEQWDSIITYATDLELCGLGTSDPNNILVLAMLMEKARMEICKRKVGVDLVHQQGSHADHWHHELLDSSAISTACSNPSFRSSDARFIRAVLGGSTEDDQTCFVSRNAKILIFKELCKNLVTFALDSTFTWVKKTCSLLTAEANDSMPRIENVLETAHFSLEVLDGSFFCLKTIEDENELVPGTLAAIFLIDWEYRLAIVSNAALDDETTRKIKSRTDFCAYVHAFRGKISSQFFKSLSLSSRNSLGSILVQSIRFAVFKEDEADIDKLTSLCCLWMLEVLEVLGQDQFEEQSLLDQFLSKGDFWPLWILPDFCTGGKPATLEIENISVNAFRNHIIVAVIDQLISKIGINSVVTGSVSRTSSSTKEATNELITSQSAYSRSWLVAEMLCTWKWHGGSALSSFLPLLSTYGKSGNFPHKESLFDSIVNILLDGALVHGASAKLSLPYVWPVSCDEMESVEEPFLRALASLVFTLFEDNIWGKDKAILLFKLLANKLFIGETINLNCLRILPLIMSIIIRPLSNGCGEPNQDVQHDSFEENEMHDTIKDWLQRTLSFPPSSTWQIGEEMEDWFHLVISCYPLSEVEGIQGLKPERSISSIERTILHELFRKLRLGSRSSTVANKLPTVQMLLSRMMVVSIGYCWKEFNDEDWEFVVYQLRSWIESAVVMMEEVAENVNEVITNISISNNSEDAVEKLEHAVSVLNPSPVKVATNALAAFSLFSGVVGLQKEENADNLNPLETERWDPIKDRILESILRLFFSTGAAEAIAGSCCSEGSFILASTRLDYPHFWELVRFNREDTAGSLDGDIGDQVSYRIDLSSEEDVHLREEISFMLKKLPYEILEMDLVAPQRVNVFLAWSLFLSHLLSLPSSSPARERLVQYIQEHADSAILDCLFQHIPLELCLAHSLKKKDVELPTMLSEAASAATRAITGSSVLFCVESLWPIGLEKMASLAAAIESFTKVWCSPPLIRNELSQIKKSSFTDENFSVSVSKSANEVVATYTKDETGMDLVIRLPASYPLRAVDVDCPRSLGISEVKQRKWLMSMLLFVRNQNGALAEAIRIWKSNFDKEFEGVEECPICYSVIHTANHSLPRLACKTCKHKFHSACLYKWFSTSHKSTCPLCQSPF
ncbi:HEAT/U-box domain-containing protein [Actinidia rufa]|uniref:E3 ubiquitin-protein ligase listerin n=1 Tax=Actinidia rufa TaxID=165716 RepID=A0A7J0HA01_9ERIC|nr:HEAT/U-box domain-containing protein [Actinidia rufa]